MYTYLDQLCKILLLLFYHLYSAAENGKLRLSTFNACTIYANFMQFKQDDKQRHNDAIFPLK